MNSRKPAPPDATRSKILDVAERLVQTRGFNGFSYADIAAEVGITKASLHYHFASKAELGATLVLRYTEAFAAALHDISSSLPDAQRRLRAYVKLYSDVLANQRMCLCGMMAAEYATLPAPMQEAIRVFFERNEGWVAEQIELGTRGGGLAVSVPARDAARMLVGALEGEMLVARAYGDPQRFATAAALLLAQLAEHAVAARAVPAGSARRLRVAGGRRRAARARGTRS